MYSNNLELNQDLPDFLLMVQSPACQFLSLNFLLKACILVLLCNYKFCSSIIHPSIIHPSTLHPFSHSFQTLSLNTTLCQTPFEELELEQPPGQAWAAFWFLFVCLFSFETWSHHVTQASLKLAVLLPRSSECWDLQVFTHHVQTMKFAFQQEDRKIFFKKQKISSGDQQCN